LTACVERVQDLRQVCGKDAEHRSEKEMIREQKESGRITE
jgi:hypothetical protein